MGPSSADARLIAWLAPRRRGLLLAMLVLLHLALLEGVGSMMDRVLMVIHIGLFFLWRRLFRHADSEVGRILPRFAILLGALIGIAVLIRGALGNKPLDVVDAFVGSRPAAAYLSLNGPFAMSRASSWPSTRRRWARSSSSKAARKGSPP